MDKIERSLKHRPTNKVQASTPYRASQTGTKYRKSIPNGVHSTFPNTESVDLDQISSIEVEKFDNPSGVKLHRSIHCPNKPPPPDIKPSSEHWPRWSRSQSPSEGAVNQKQVGEESATEGQKSYLLEQSAAAHPHCSGFFPHRVADR